MVLSTTTKVAAVGNCQAQVISDLLNISGSRIRAMPFMVHALSEKRRHLALKNLSKYDISLSQKCKTFSL